MYRNSSFSKALDIAISLKTPKISLLTAGKLITYVSTSSFMYVFRSPSTLSKSAETLLGGNEELYLGGRRGCCA
jgi:hypothetical protein